MAYPLLRNLRASIAALYRIRFTREQVWTQELSVRALQEASIEQQKQVDLLTTVIQNDTREVMMRKLEAQNLYLAQEIALLKQSHSQLLAASASMQGQTKPVAASNFDFDRFYTAFEDRFRGSMEDITNRLRVYLPYIKRAVSATHDKAIVLDIGCGRGEWLALLRDENIDAVGVDMNTDMVNKCEQRGLNAKCADAIQYLRMQPKGSLAAVTGFHIIEHLPFEKMIEMMDAAHTALCENGIIIFETPNPENLTVGACTFYYDPTHLHPIVPAFAEFTAQQRGYKNVEIVRLHPKQASEQIQDSSELAQHLNQVLNGPQDFALIAQR